MPGIHEAFQLWQSDPIAARRRFRTLAEEGDPRAMYAYGLMLSTGRGGGSDPASGATWLLRAAEQDHPLACWSYAAACAEGRGVPADPALAAQWYRRAADLGDRDAMHALGLLYASGDPDEAARWWRRAAARGHPEALRSLGDSLAATDLAAAAAFWLEAAVAGDDGAVEVLARTLPQVRALVDAGSGAAAWVAAAFADDQQERAHLSALAVERGHGRACYDQAERVRRGEAPGGVAERIALLERAAAAGCEEADHDLATLHATSAGVPRDLRAAVDRYRRAASWGRPASLCGLGAALLELGEDRGADEGLEALRQAAIGGHGPAMMLYAAQLAASDKVEALRWLLEADVAGQDGALDAARQVAARMSPDEVLQADRRTSTDGSAAAALLAGEGPEGGD